MSVFLLILGIVLLIFLIIIHEFGHFIVAKRNKVIIEEFGIGFPPTALSKTMTSGYTLSLNWLPLGGFVRLKGEHDGDLGKGSFGGSSLWTKTKIISAGVGMNLIASFIILTFLAIIGLPQIVNNQFSVAKDSTTVEQKVLAGYIQPNSPASKIGIKSQDSLVSIVNSRGQTVSVSSIAALSRTTKNNAGDIIIINYKHNGINYSSKVMLRTTADVSASIKTNNPKGYLGIVPSNYIVKRYTWSAPIVSVGFMEQITVLTFKGIGNAIMGLMQGNTAKASSQVSGPVGIIILLKNGSLLGYKFILLIIAIISLSLAIINILPIPALDGGRLFFTVIPRVLLKRPLKQKTEELIHGGGMMALLLIFVLITIVDIKRYF
ncbi:MAG TPA: site-2 protease family protein [Candidatus Dormibacteraeota bacterium]|nr:site-2 protease family protein [Candidatus Dormibacteraeota bacterium]